MSTLKMLDKILLLLIKSENHTWIIIFLSFKGGNIRKPILNDLYFNQSKIGGIKTDINAAGNAVNVKTLKEQLANYLHIDGSEAMTGNLDIGSKNVLNLENLTDYKVDDPIDYRIKDLKSAVNKEYLNEKFLKVDKDDNYFDLKQNTTKNCEPCESFCRCRNKEINQT